jgi:hypothetical protein
MPDVLPRGGQPRPTLGRLGAVHQVRQRFHRFPAPNRTVALEDGDDVFDWNAQPGRATFGPGRAWSGLGSCLGRRPSCVTIGVEPFDSRASGAAQRTPHLAQGHQAVGLQRSPPDSGGATTGARRATFGVRLSTGHPGSCAQEHDEHAADRGPHSSVRPRLWPGVASGSGPSSNPGSNAGSIRPATESCGLATRNGSSAASRACDSDVF